MYLARKQINHQTHYVLRQSYADGGIMRSRDLIDLGDCPESFIVYPDNGNAFYFDEDLCQALRDKGVEPDNRLLEKVFWPFFTAETRRLLERFSRSPAGRPGRLAEARRRCETTPFHVFDRRRMHYLRYGELDQSGLDRVPKKIYRKLLDKSRDEIEQQFLTMEQVLREHEKKNYVFAVFNLAGHFDSEIARKFPLALSDEKVDACFVEELCRLNADAAFWSDLPVTGTLHSYLIRYACWFFDTAFSGGAYLDDLAWQFRRRHHGFRPPPPRQHMPEEEALAMLGIASSELVGMTVGELTRRYRIMAKRHHPDRGGGHEPFIRLTRAFEDVLRRIKAGAGKAGYYTRRG